MTNSGVAIMGSGRASGENRAVRAIEAALASPLLNNNDISGARNILLNITSGTKEVTMDEISQITEYIHGSAGNELDLIWGNGVDASLEDEVNVTIIATGFATSSIPELYTRQPKTVDVITLEGEKHTLTEAKVGTTITFERDNVRQAALDFSINNDVFEEDGFVVKTLTEDLLADSGKARPVSKTPSGPIHKSELSVEQAEKEPAYVRKNVVLEDKEYSKTESVSKYTLSEDNELPLKPNNSYLHDQVD
jgi:cell division protein FtsZ